LLEDEVYHDHYIQHKANGHTAYADSRSSSDEESIQDEDKIVVQVNRPRAATTIAAIEAILTLTEFSIAVVILVRHTWAGQKWEIAAISAAVVWGYISILALLRLTGQKPKASPLAKLWNHTAALYALQWVFTVIVFRSAILHPRSDESKRLMIASFTCSTLLFLTSLTSRRGNRVVLLQHEKQIKPSREPLASVLSLLTFSWLDPLIWDGYKSPLEINRVWNILPKEKAATVLENYRLLKKSGRLTIHLLKFFSPDLLFQQIWALIGAVFTFVPTLLLKAILEYVENPAETPKSTAWLYVILLLASGLIQGVADGQGLWRGRKICIKLRAIMVGEIYAKTLRRKAASSGDTDMTSDQEGKKKRSLLDRILGRKKDESNQNDANQSKSEKSDTQVNSGTIINLMSVDSFKVAEISAYWHFLIPSVPVQLIISIFLLFRILGWSAFAGLAVMIAVLPLNVFFSNQFSQAHKRIMSATDGRIHTTNEVLQNVRIIKYFAWEDRFSRKIDEKRHVEIGALKYRFALWIGASAVWFGVPMLITAFSFFIYTFVENRPLYPSVAFTALSLFQLLRYPLDRLADMMAHVLEAKVSVDRVEKFLLEEETGKYEQLAPASFDGEEEFIGFKNANFSWGPRDEPKDMENPTFRLINMDIKFHIGGLNVIAGPTGSGKTSLLMALLGEMTLLNGSVHLPGGYDRQTLKPRDDGLTDSVAYCAQQAWLVNDTIKQNIVFASAYDENRYQNVLKACALQRDLEVFENGDSTLVGEKGIVVSGGQKQRISLARALYSNARYVILDDCLSAVDSHTAQHIFEHCINGPLMFNRTCILVTHNVALCVPTAQHVVVLNNGKIQIQGTPEQIIASGALGKDMKSGEDSRPATKGHSRALSRSESTLINLPEGGNEQLNGATKDLSKGKKQEEVKNANTRTEDKATGSVDWKVVKLYLTSMGPWWFWMSILIGFTLENMANVATNVWIRQWANSYSSEAPELVVQSTSTYYKPASPHEDSVFWAPFKRIFPVTEATSSLSLYNVTSINNGYFLGIYVSLGFLYITICTLRLSLTFRGSIKASRKIHTALLNAVLRAKFKFFDTTPLGQITNRFSKDLEAIDQDISPCAAGVLQSLFSIVSIVILISIITPGFLIAGAFLTALYTAIGAFYIQSSRDLKRLESAQRSPLYQQFGETLSGVTTIRAYGDERRFIEDNARRVDTHNRPFIFLWAANRWLALRVDWAGALVSFFAAVFVVINVGRIDAGAAGLSLTYALGFNENILWLVRLYAENEQNMNHVERVKAFLEIEQEAPAQIPEKKPTGSWPSEGAVEFVDYSTRYRPDLEPVLRHLSFKIKAQEKVGIVGRTGAGKSSLAMALFRGLEADSGKIMIDNVDIGIIGLQDLRENLTIVPQDPTLFTGTIRSNLDPFELFSDEEIFTALRQVHLIGPNSVASGSSSVVNDPDQDAPTRTRTNESVFEDVEVPPSTADVTAPSPMVARRTSVSVPQELAPPMGENLTQVLTNTRENTNIFHNLNSPVAESGTNLSQGQRQLLCLARALLKSPRVLVMDEATASIDYATDAKIQDTLRELKGSTIITIAHRLQTIIDYDKVLVLEKGEVAEYGAPWELIAKTDGMFRSMCDMSGDFDILMDMAKKAEQKSKLVDV
jgi:ABC-type multidrug transport system fused ATPase/permease subunit